MLAAAVLAACGGGDGDSAALNTKPTYLGAISGATYDGTSNDLLTAGLGATGLAAAVPPAYADPLKPHRSRAAPARPSTPTTAPCLTWWR